MNCKKCGHTLPSDAKFCNKCGTPVEAAKELVNIQYFSVTPSRLALFSFLTLGIYEIFWFYRNWLAVKNAENTNIAPLARAIFVIFYCHSLFVKILKSAKNHGYQQTYSTTALAAAYILLLIAGNALSRVESTDPLFNIVWISFFIFSFIPLLFVQKAINFNNEKINAGAVPKSGFSGGEVVAIILGLIFWGFIIWGTFIPSESVTLDDVNQQAGTYTTAELVEATVKEIQGDMQLPSQIDDVTTLVDVTAERNAIRYHYTLTGADTSKLSNSYLKEYLGSSICKNADTQALLVHEIDMEYSYVIAETGERYFVSFTKSDCSQ